MKTRVGLARLGLIVLGFAMLGLAGCGGDEPPSARSDTSSPDAPARQPRGDLLAALQEDLAAVRHPADGGGRAWLEAGEAAPPAVVSTPGRWRIVYETGPLGIAEGGMIFLQASPFWGWSTPQVRYPEAAGYTAVSTAAEDVTLAAETLDQQLLGITVGGRALEPGEQVWIDYGAGSVGAVADRYAEHDEHLWIAVDGDGDGVRSVLVDSPTLTVLPGPAAGLVVTLPSTARPGETVRLNLAAVDAVGNQATGFAGAVQLEGTSVVSGLPAEVAFAPEHGGVRQLALTVVTEGVVRIAATLAGGQRFTSNPLQISARGGRVLWGDLQNHSNFSDGTATPEDLMAYGRDVAALDVIALTDHDHWGMLFLDQHPQRWQQIVEANRTFHLPGRYVTLLGYEWTNWVYGHRHVLFFGDEGEILSSVAPAYETPTQLWAGLRGVKSMTIAHHSAGGPIATDWSIPPDPMLEPVTEIVSVHGSSEAEDTPGRIYRPVPGNFVRDALDRGYRLGFLGSSDGHDGHPGLGHLAAPNGGLAAILSEELSREAVYDALQARRVYATNGPRILLRTSFAGYRMGEAVPVRPEARQASVVALPADVLLVQVMAPGALARIDVIRDGELNLSVDCGGELDCAFSHAFEDFAPGSYLYVRVVQEDGGAAWSSPFFFE